MRVQSFCFAFVRERSFKLLQGQLVVCSGWSCRVRERNAPHCSPTNSCRTSLLIFNLNDVATLYGLDDVCSLVTVVQLHVCRFAALFVMAGWVRRGCLTSARRWWVAQ
jgi:hypothetical protein